MIKIIAKTILITFLLTANVFSQNETSLSPNVSAMKDEELILKLSSKDETMASNATSEVFNRGSRMIPFLLKLKGNREIYEGYCLSDTFGGMGISHPISDALSEEVKIGIENGWYVTIEVVSLYLISAIYYDNLAFAQVPYLSGKKPVKEKRYNTPERIKKAWKATEKWYEKLQKDGLVKLRNDKEFPLKSTEIHFYGTNPERKRDLSDCEK